MPDTITVRLNKEEQEYLENSAKLYNCSVSSMVKRMVIERIEDEIDLKSLIIL